MEINKINVNGTSYDIQDSRVNATDIASMLDAANYVPSAASGGTTYTAGTGINISNGEISVDSSVYTTSNAPTDTNTTYSLTVNGTTNGDANGTSLGTLYAPTTAGTSGQVWKSNGSGGEWGTVSASVGYPDVTYTVATQSTSGSISIDGSKPVHVITLTGNASAVTLSTQPAEGHSTHVFFYSTSQRTVAIAHNATTSRCPEATALSLTVKANGYVEVDFLKANGVIYVRGV